MTLPVGAALLEAQAQTPAATLRGILELRYFHLRAGRQVEKTTAYLQHGLLPAWERAGIRPTGCFSTLIGPDTPFMMTVASYASLAAFETAREKLGADKELQAASDEYNTLGELSYLRLENSLLSVFTSYPTVTPPPLVENHPARVFELRTYEAPTEKGLKRKIELFGMGEFDIFRRHQMLPVFAGQMLVGTHMPNLTYMLAYDDLAAREKGWNAFVADPDWLKLKASAGMPDAEMVSNTTNLMLRPLPFSAIR